MKAIHWVLPSLTFLLFSLTANALGVEPVKIGLLISPQESKTVLAPPYLRGAEMAVAELNSREKKQGIQFLLVLRQGHHGGEKETKELRRIILEEPLHFLLGSMPKEGILPVAKLAQEEKIPFLVFPLDFAATMSTGADPANLFWISPAPEAFQRAAVRTAVQFPLKRIFLLAQDTHMGRSWVKYFWEELRRLKPDAEPRGKIFLPKKVGDYGAHLRSILAAKAEVCLSHLGTKEWVRFVKAAEKQEYFKKIIHFELESGNLETLVALQKDNPEGIWGVSAFPFWALHGPETKEFVSQYRKNNRSYPELAALSGYVSIYALLEAIKKGGSLDPERVLKTLPGLTFPTPIGPLAIRASDHRALWPIWCGKTKIVDDYPFAILGDLKAFGPDSFPP